MSAPYARPPRPPDRDYMAEPDNLIEAPPAADFSGAMDKMMKDMIEGGDYSEEEREQLRGLSEYFGEGMQNLQDAMAPFVGVFDARLEGQEKALKELIAIVDQQEKDLKAFETWATDTFRREVAESFLEFADLCERHGMHIPEHWRANLQKVAGK